VTVAYARNNNLTSASSSARNSLLNLPARGGVGSSGGAGSSRGAGPSGGAGSSRGAEPRRRAGHRSGSR